MSGVGTVPGSMRAKLEVRSFSHFGAIRIYPIPLPLQKRQKKTRGHVTMAGGVAVAMVTCHRHAAFYLLLTCRDWRPSRNVV